MALNAYLAARDYVVVSINYRLAPKWKFPAGRDDVLAAIAYLKVYGREFGVDATRLALLGRSAGGQLALLAAYTAGEPAIRGVVSVYGPTDLKFGYDRPALQGPARHARRARELSRRITGEGRRGVLRGVADQLRDRRRRRRHCSSTGCTTATSLPEESERLEAKLDAGAR